MLHGNLGQKILGIMACVTMLITMSPSVFAAEPHENPETAKVVFSGIAFAVFPYSVSGFILRYRTS